MENFVVSARKYRPVTFTSVVGQSHITSTLKNAIGRSQLAHAYLFCGPRGVGKTTCARIFAKAINCLAPVDNEACGECESCKGFSEGRSFNIHELDAASNNSVEDIRSLTDQVRIPPQLGRYSVYIIDEVHMLSSAAFNAFLKTLEEPPSHAIFILATTEKHKIIPTILSRCQIFDFNRIRVEDGVEYLRFIAKSENVTVDDESLHLIAQKADGGMRDALSMFDKAVSFCGTELDYRSVATTLNVLDYDTYFTATKSILTGDYEAALLLFDDILRKGFSGQIFITGLNSHFRDLLMCKDARTLPLLEVSGSVLQRYTEQSKECDAGLLFNAIALLTALDGTLRSSSNQRLSVELGLMKLCGLGQKKNEPLTSPSLPTVADFPLPDINGVASVATASAVSQTVASPVAATPATTTPEAAPAPSSAETIPSQEPKPAEQRLKVTISGKSIASLLNSVEHTPEQKEQAATQSAIDPESESKIEAVREKFIAKLKANDPRAAMAFLSMKVEGNRISLGVANDLLREDIIRDKTELLYLLASLAKIDGILELEVEVRESDTPLRPIKPEDKLAFLVEKNPLMNRLKREFDLDIE